MRIFPDHSDRGISSFFLEDNWMQRKEIDYMQTNVEPTGKEKDRFVSLGSLSAVVTAILASACCVGPFVLVMLGVSGAWIGNLRVFEPYRPFFILFTLGFLVAGFYRVYRRPAGDCKPGSSCNISSNQRMKKVLWIITILIIFLLVFPYLIALWV